MNPRFTLAAKPAAKGLRKTEIGYEIRLEVELEHVRCFVSC